MRLIDANELLTAFPVDDEPMLTKSCVRMTIQRMPTIDAIEVVRCKDCKYQDKGENESESWNVCNLLHFSIDDDDYCSSGERKGGLTDDHNTGKI